MPALAADDHGPDAQRAYEAAVPVVVVAAVADDFVRATPWPADEPGHRRQPLEQGISWVTSLRLPPVSA